MRQTLFLSFLCISLWAEEAKPVRPAAVAAVEFHPRPSIAVLPFKNTNALAQQTGYGESVAAMLTTIIRNGSNFLVLERSKLSSVVDEQKISQLGLTQDMSERLEKLYQVDVILLGDISCIENTVQVDARLIEVKSGKVVAAEAGIAPSPSKLRETLTDLAKEVELKYLRPFLGSVEIIPTNVEAEVYLSGLYKGHASAHSPLALNNLLEGNYPLRLIAGGFYNYEENVLVQAKMNRQVKVSLRGKPGSMTITSDPPGATVFIDNSNLGATPLTLDEVAEGEHEITLTLANYNTWKKVATVQSFQPTSVKATLEVKPGVLIVNSIPTGADVTVKGKFVGRCPIRLENLPPGEAALRVSAVGCEDFVQSLLVKPNEQILINAELVKMQGKLDVYSSPSGAGVFLRQGEGPAKEIGKTPLLSYPLGIGEYALGVGFPDFYPLVKKADIRNKSLTSMEFTLQQMPGRIEVRSGFSDAKVYVKGEYQGRAPIAVENLTAGTYRVSVETPYTFFETKVDVLPNKTAVVESRDHMERKSVVAVIAFALVSLGLWGAL